jgi:hypothetical protein
MLGSQNAAPDLKGLAEERLCRRELAFVVAKG